MENLLPVQRCLNGRKRDCNQPLLGRGFHLSSLRGEVGKGHWEWETLYTYQSRIVSFSLSVVTTYPSLQQWKSLASRFRKVHELVLGSLLPYFECSPALCTAGTSSEGAPERSISILFSLWRRCTHKAGGYVSRLIYLFYFGLEKLSQLG